jgi:transcriptional regulator with XRE-family HTH domain
MNNIAKRLKHYRKKAGLTQETVASALEIRPANYSKYERGERVPKDERLIALSRLFGVSYNALYTGLEREFKELIAAHIAGAVIGNVEGFYAYECDFLRNNEAYEIVTACFEKWGNAFSDREEEQWVNVCDQYLSEPDLGSLITLYDRYRIAADNPVRINELFDSEKLCKLAFCIAVHKYLADRFSADPEDILTEAEELLDTELITPLQFFAVKVFVPYFSFIYEAVDLTENTVIDDFENAFLCDALVFLPDDEENDGDDDDDE